MSVPNTSVCLATLVSWLVIKSLEWSGVCNYLVPVYVVVAVVSCACSRRSVKGAANFWFASSQSFCLYIYTYTRAWIKRRAGIICSENIKSYFKWQSWMILIWLRDTSSPDIFILALSSPHFHTHKNNLKNIRSKSAICKDPYVRTHNKIFNVLNVTLLSVWKKFTILERKRILTQQKIW